MFKKLAVTYVSYTKLDRGKGIDAKRLRSIFGVFSEYIRSIFGENFHASWTKLACDAEAGPV